MQRTTIYKLVEAGRFPRFVKVGGASLWFDHEITAWMAAQLKARDDPVGAAVKRKPRNRRST